MSKWDDDQTAYLDGLGLYTDHIEHVIQSYEWGPTGQEKATHQLSALKAHIFAATREKIPSDPTENGAAVLSTEGDQ